jgi:hypothetical protein
VTKSNIKAEITLPAVIKTTAHRNLCALKGKVCQCDENTDNNADQLWDVYDALAFMMRIIGAVNVATAHHEQDERKVSFVGAKDRHSQVNPEAIARTFRCGIETAKRALNIRRWSIVQIQYIGPNLS